MTNTTQPEPATDEEVALWRRRCEFGTQGCCVRDHCATDDPRKCATIGTRDNAIAALIARFDAERAARERAEGEAETERLRLVACGMAALDPSQLVGMVPAYDSASRQDVTRVVERLIECNEWKALLARALEVIEPFTDWMGNTDDDDAQIYVAQAFYAEALAAVKPRV